MGDSTSSMFYAFAAFIVIYLVGCGIYTAVQAVRKLLERKKNGGESNYEYKNKYKTFRYQR